MTCYAVVQLQIRYRFFSFSSFSLFSSLHFEHIWTCTKCNISYKINNYTYIHNVSYITQSTQRVRKTLLWNIFTNKCNAIHAKSSGCSFFARNKTPQLQNSYRNMSHLKQLDRIFLFWILTIQFKLLHNATCIMPWKTCYLHHHQLQKETAAWQKKKKKKKSVRSLK